MVLVLGIGNPTRSDDGAGFEVIRRLEGKKLQGLETHHCQQLGLELLEEWGAFEKVILVDASPGASRTSLEKIEISDSLPPVSTHHLSPEFLLRLSKTLYGQNPELYLCRIPANQFNFGEILSENTQKGVEEAVQSIEKWLMLDF
jgi:hydrogenase maturation protease